MDATAGVLSRTDDGIITGPCGVEASGNTLGDGGKSVIELLITNSESLSRAISEAEAQNEDVGVIGRVE
jgi:hypothetical protein